MADPAGRFFGGATGLISPTKSVFFLVFDHLVFKIHKNKSKKSDFFWKSDISPPPSTQWILTVTVEASLASPRYF